MFKLISQQQELWITRKLLLENINVTLNKIFHVYYVIVVISRGLLYKLLADKPGTTRVLRPQESRFAPLISIREDVHFWNP